ncbi:DEAD-domain-containing protein [Exidia glandulosa HHB12029]|uniref:DEAD-domain-containing protein n=1 Tax=Exidia glandulosa HHB12029 TaxID=1314781 RepID=A0A165GGQ0_EXIGL|nr:DEAD-domain-containing protein [Exidia glandulosa HHB12029]
MAKASTKRKSPSPTADDLMRMAESAPRKRQKLTARYDDEDEAATIPANNEDSDDDESAFSRLPARIAAKRASSPVPTGPAKTAQNTGFGALGVSQQLITALSSMSIRQPTDVQAACIPPLLAGKDCIGNARTGSGKTIAFALPILQRLAVDPYGIFALVLTPTRELAFQIADQFAVLGGTLGIRTAVVVGGMDMMTQAIELCRRPHVVIATPGRMVDHLNSSSGEWDLSRVKFLVLDEADRLLQQTFAPELAVLMNAIPKERQTCLFTATLTPAIEALAAAPPKHGKEPPFVHRMPEEGIETVSTLTQLYILVPSHVREVYLYHLLRNPPESTVHLRRAAPEPAKKGKNASDVEPIVQPPPTIIFTARARSAAYLTALLQTLSIRSTSLHSRLTQRERLNNLNLFKSYVVPVLVCTDVGARGLDIDDVALVVNWDMPQEPEEYTHRVGRTARAGKGGVAVSFVTERDEEKVLKIEDRIKTKLEEMSMSEEKVLDNMNAVFAAKRLANMELHDSDFGKREEVHKIKKAKKEKAAAKSTATKAD